MLFLSGTITVVAQRRGFEPMEYQSTSVEQLMIPVIMQAQIKAMEADAEFNKREEYYEICRNCVNVLDELYGYIRDNKELFITYDYDQILTEIDGLCTEYENLDSYKVYNVKTLNALNARLDKLFSERDGYKKAQYNFRQYQQKKRSVEPSIAKWLLEVYASKKGYLGDFQFKN